MSGLDLAVARLTGGAQGFPLRAFPLLETTLHIGTRNIGWLMLALFCVGIFRPFGFLRRLDSRERLQLPLSISLGLLVVAVMKYTSHTSCPWDLREFGGVLPHVSHWNLGSIDGGPGHCFPAGHAATGFAFIGGYFALRRRMPLLARRWLMAALAVGLALGLCQQWRGAHFTSHTLWTAWLCWTIGGLVDMVSHRRMARSGE
ncbi:phosphatase PAP2 family protein [Xylophilus rhododendri]|uniref:Phosphatase PAP2 family protein n=2 Tax=Xylophilus rhododendri TaxID=2697032 RepID=A0A857J9B6_9BURK|nr:phosphatase PAP2 family protein [Xylophilus rhododendri]